LPFPDAGGPYFGNVGEPVIFDGSGSYDPNEDPLTYEWNLGNGNIRYGEIISYTYNIEGIYDVYLTVSDYEYSRTAIAQAYIINEGGDGDGDGDGNLDDENEPPEADAGGPYTGLVGQSIEFDASHSTDDLGIVTYQWDFGDGAPIVTTTINEVSHIYSNEGNYVVQLTVQDEQGETDSDTATVTINEIPQSYTITLETDNKGIAWINPDKTSYTQGEPVTITASAFSGYEFDTWNVNPYLGGVDLYENPITFNMPNYDLTINAFFKDIKIEGGGGEGDGDGDGDGNQDQIDIDPEDEDENNETPGNDQDSNDEDTNQDENDDLENNEDSDEDESDDDENTYDESENVFDVVEQNTPQTVEPDNSDDTGFEQVHFKLKEKKENVTFSIKRLNSAEFVNKQISDPNGLVIKYLDIDLHAEKGTSKETYLGDDYVESMSFRFSIKKSTIRSKNINPYSIKLLRYHDAEWSDLNIVQISGNDDDNNFYFFATTEQLSTFAVVGDEIVNPTPVTQDDFPIEAIIAFVCTSLIALTIILYKGRYVYDSKEKY
jgi:PGF-pre-PGF domain-containing protein